MDEQRFYTALVGGSTPSPGTVAMVYWRLSRVHARL